MLTAGHTSRTDNPLIDIMGGGSAQVEIHMLHKSITSDITFKCGVSVSRRIGQALADSFSNSLPRSIHSDTTAPSSGVFRHVLQIPPELLWYF